MVIIGSDTTILIDTVDYSGSIFEYTESGGDLNYSMVKTFGNNYIHVPKGRSEYEISLKFRMEDATLETLYKTETPMEIVLNISDAFTITYSNAKPKIFTIEDSVEDFVQGTLTFVVPPVDETGTDNRSVL